MYLENPKKLFKDLKNIPTMYSYMVACAEDGENENLRNLLSIVGCNRGELHEGGEGSERWNLEYCETQEEVNQKYKDSRMIDAIYKQIQKELKAKYVAQCENCKHAWFYQRYSKCISSALDSDTNTYSTYKCFCKGKLKVYTMEEWCTSEGIDLKEITRYM